MPIAEPQTEAKRILMITLIVTLISVAGIALPYPILAPLFEQGDSALSQFMGLPKELLLGIVLGVYPLGIIIGSSFIGSLSDSYGRRRLLTLTLVGSGFGYSATAFAALSGNFALFCIARLLTGVCEGNISIARAIAADLHPIIDKARSFSLISAMGYGGYLLGPLLGGYLIYSGIETVFVVAALACFICAGLSHFMMPATLNKTIKAPSHSSSLVLLRQTDLRRFFMLYLLLTTGVNLYYEYYPLHLVRQFNYTPVDISWATVFLTACMIFTSIWVNPIIQQRMSHARAGLVGVMLFGSALVALPFIDNQFYLISFALMGAGIAIYNGFLPVYLSNSYQNNAQGQLMGMLVTVFCLGNLFAAGLGSVLSMIDVKWSLLGGALVTFFAAAVFFHGHYKAQIWPQPINVNNKALASNNE